MSEIATYIGIEPRTAINASTVAGTNITIPRGTRVALNTSGLVAAAGTGVRGDYVTMTDIAPSETGVVASMNGGGKVPMVASVAVAINDPVYPAANGQVTNVAGTLVIGKFTQPTSGAGQMTEVELEAAF